MNNLLIILVTIFLSLIGFILIKGFDLLPNKKNMYIFGLSYGMGVGIVSQQLFLLNILNFGWNIKFIILFWIIIISIILFLKKQTFKIKLKKTKLKKIDLSILLLIFAQTIYTFIESIIRPLSTWDGWAIWLNKSKFFFLDGKIVPASLMYIHSSYPLILSLLGLFDYLILGKVNDVSVLISFFAFYFFMVILFYSALRERVSLRYALFFTLFLVGIQNFTRHGGRIEVGQADLPLAYFFLSSSLLLLEYIKDKKNKTLVLLSLFLAFTWLIKLEGILFVLVCLAIISISLIKFRKLKHIFLLIILFSPVFLWEYFKKTNQITSLPDGRGVSFYFFKSFHIFLEFIKESLNLKTWNILWPIYFFSLFFGKALKSSEMLVINFLILSQLFFYIAIYLFISIYEPSSSLQRLALHVAPLCVYSVALVFRKTINAR